MGRLWLFCRSVLRHWGALATGGCIIGLIGVWQGTGHAVAAWVYILIASCALLASFFKAWNEQFEATQVAMRRIEEIEGRPDLTLEIRPLRKGETLARTMGRDERTLYEFVVTNGGPGQAANVSLKEVQLPMSENVRLDAAAMRLAHLAEEGKTIDDIKKEDIRSDKWVIAFETLSSVASGKDAVLPFRISNMGPLQNQDICWALQNTIRTLAPLTLPLVVRFSNRDGYTWEQRYELTHEFKCHITLQFGEVALVNRPENRQKR